jgi:hypothetical protein
MNIENLLLERIDEDTVCCCEWWCRAGSSSVSSAVGIPLSRRSSSLTRLNLEARPVEVHFRRGGKEHAVFTSSRSPVLKNMLEHEDTFVVSLASVSEIHSLSFLCEFVFSKHAKAQI